MNRHDRVYDVPNRYEYFYTKEVNGKLCIWGAYVTHYRHSWDNTGNFKVRDKVILFSGVFGKKIRFTKSVNNDRLVTYASKHRKDGYKCLRYGDIDTHSHLGEEFNKMIQERFPNIHEGVSKQVFWLTLQD